VPILRDFERRLGGLVEGLFAKTFRSGLQPVELAKRVLREMDARKTVSVAEIWAPNRFVFELAPEDGERFEQAEAALVAELEEVVRENAADRGWGLVGPAEVSFEVDPDLKKGEFNCRAALVEGEERVEPVPTVGAWLEIAGDGADRSVVLTSDVVTIGRLPECDVTLTDRGASRHHAQIRVRSDRYTLTDLGSTNGTRLNGQTIQSHDLVDGDRISIGATILEFHRGRS